MPILKLVPGGKPKLVVRTPAEEKALLQFQEKRKKKARAHARRKPLYVCVCPDHGPMMPTAAYDIKVSKARKVSEKKRLRCSCDYTPVFKFQVDRHAKVRG